MSQERPKALLDGFISAERGVDSGRSPSLLQNNQFSFAVNTTFRGGFPTNRPAYNNIPISFPENNSFQGQLFQGSFIYSPDNGLPFLVAMIGGHLYQITTSGIVKDISVPNDFNPSNRGIVYFEQAENFLIVQDGQTSPLIFNGAVSRRATNNEVPVGTTMAYGIGRLWVAIGNGQYVGGDIVGGPSGTATNRFRDAVIKFTENTFLAEGGSFSLPVKSGAISGMAFTANINTATGQGSLVVGSRNTVCTAVIPPDRTTWKDLQQPIQTIAQLSYGFQGHSAMAVVNGDLWYRSKDGFRSLIIAVRNFGIGWGNTPMSKEMNRILKLDDKRLLKYGSMVNFDNRLLATASPVQTPYGVYHRGLAVLDFDLISSMGGRGISDTLNPPNPAWEGVWTGLNILQLVVGDFDDIERCFVFSLNANNEIEVWELTTDGDFDNGDTLIDWWLETPSYRFGDGFNLKELHHGELSYDRLKGEVDFNVKYRPDQYPFWKDWLSWSECATFKDCDLPKCQQPNNYGEQYRPKKALTQPADDFIPGLNRMFRHGYEFQTRIEVTGCARLKQCRFVANDIPESPLGELPDVIPCQGLIGCDESVFSYSIEATASAGGDVTKLNQTITFLPVSNKKNNATPFGLSASSDSGLPITFTIISGPATVSGDTATLTGFVGDVIIRASQSGNSSYNAASDVTQVFHVYDHTVSIRIASYVDGMIGTCAACAVESSDVAWDGSFRVDGDSWATTNPDEFTFALDGKSFFNALIAPDSGVYNLTVYCADVDGHPFVVWNGIGPSTATGSAIGAYNRHPSSCASSPSTLTVENLP